jgi:2-dehydropantoate 2-reductase
VIVCEQSDRVRSPTDQQYPTDACGPTPETAPGIRSDEGSLVDFCHTVAGVVFETVADSAHTGVQSEIMDRYLDLAETVGSAFAEAGIESRIAADMAPHRWEKLAVNAGINPVTALARVENGTAIDGPTAPIAEGATREVARTARAAGVDLPDREARAALRRVARATAANRSSMLQDVDAGRRTEIDAIAGAVVDHADEPVPINETLLRLVQAWEAGRGLR